MRFAAALKAAYKGREGVVNVHEEARVVSDVGGVRRRTEESVLLEKSSMLSQCINRKQRTGLDIGLGQLHIHGSICSIE